MEYFVIQARLNENGKRIYERNGWRIYELRCHDFGDGLNIEQNVLANFYGTLFANNQIKFNPIPNDYMDFEEFINDKNNIEVSPLYLEEE